MLRLKLQYCGHLMRRADSLEKTLMLGKTEGRRKVKVKSLSRVRFFATQWAVAYQPSSVHGILQARILEWVTISFARGSSRPRDRTQVSSIVSKTNKTLYRLSHKGSLAPRDSEALK